MSFERFSTNGVEFLAFHPSELGIYAEPQGGSRATPLTADEALRRSGAEAVLDGPMFAKGDESKTYAQQTSGTVLYRHFDLSSGQFPTRYPSRGMTISVFPDGSTQAVSGSAVPSGARVSVQLYPELVVNGRSVEVSDNGPASRAALVILDDGRMAFAVSPPMSLPDFADALAASHVLYAGYTDGGGSTSLAATGFYAGSSEHRKVLTWLLAKKPTSPLGGGVGVALAAIVIGVGAWMFWKGRGSRRNPSPRPNPILRNLTVWPSIFGSAPRISGTAEDSMRWYTQWRGTRAVEVTGASEDNRRLVVLNFEVTPDGHIDTNGKSRKRVTTFGEEDGKQETVESTPTFVEYEIAEELISEHFPRVRKNPFLDPGIRRELQKHSNRPAATGTINQRYYKLFLTGTPEVVHMVSRVIGAKPGPEDLDYTFRVRDGRIDFRGGEKWTDEGMGHPSMHEYVIAQELYEIAIAKPRENPRKNSRGGTRGRSRKNPSPPKALNSGAPRSLNHGPYRYSYHWADRGEDGLVFIVERQGASDADLREWYWPHMVYGASRLPSKAYELVNSPFTEESIPLFDFLAAEKLFDADYDWRFRRGGV